jgi:hypothetical protein
MHAAAATLGATGGAAEELREQPPGGEPLGESVTMTTVRAEDDVFLLKMRANTGRYGFLSDVRVTRTVYKPALMRSGQLLFAATDEHHRSIKRCKLGFL